MEKSPSAEKQREAKRGKARIESKSNSARQDIQMRFSLSTRKKKCHWSLTQVARLESCQSQ